MPALLSRPETDASPEARFDDHAQARLQTLREETETLNEMLCSINVMLIIHRNGQVIVQVKSEFECRASDISKLFNFLEEHRMSINHVIFLHIRMYEVVYQFLDGIVGFFRLYADELCLALQTFKMSDCANIYTMFHGEEDYNELESVLAMNGWSVSMPEAPGSFLCIEKRKRHCNEAQ